jgi:NTP pyrophosphatase (non-canonical NTP hydrolase)
MSAEETRKFSNQLSDAELERLAILSEEMGEAQQAIGKIIRHGYESFDPTKSEEMFIETEGTNRRWLEKELGDVRWAIGLLCAAGDVEHGNILKRRDQKGDRAQPYLHHQG